MKMSISMYVIKVDYIAFSEVDKQKDMTIFMHLQLSK